MKVWTKYIYILHAYTYGKHNVNQSVLLTGKSGTSAIGIYTSQWSTDQAEDYRLFSPRHASVFFPHFTTLSRFPSAFFLLSFSLSFSPLIFSFLTHYVPPPVLIMRFITEFRKVMKFKKKKQRICFDMYFTSNRY